MFCLICSHATTHDRPMQLQQCCRSTWVGTRLNGGTKYAALTFTAWRCLGPGQTYCGIRRRLKIREGTQGPAQRDPRDFVFGVRHCAGDGARPGVFYDQHRGGEDQVASVPLRRLSCRVRGDAVSDRPPAGLVDLAGLLDTAALIDRTGGTTTVERNRPTQTPGSERGPAGGALTVLTPSTRGSVSTGRGT